ncbi:MAG: dTDP-4-dehydrorhamnose 3,5-epimerase [Gammaproteobacteria bacterium]|nr:dTDP-4-dehydrorhamnose 3,5-epimerase [Gammaproteobacteria bacterium]
MNVIETAIRDVKIVEPVVYRDARGFFLESYNERRFREAIGREVHFVQDNHSRSQRHVLRGLHYQIEQVQAKLVRVVCGEIFDVAVDLRRTSATFGRWVGERLSADSHRQLWIEEGFAHGFLVLSDVAEVLYKTTDYWSPEHERCLAWNDAELAIDWPLDAEPLLSDRDRRGVPLARAQCYP